MYRQIHTSIWKKPWFLDLEPQEKLLFIYLFSNDTTHLTGLYEISLRTMASETCLDMESVKQILAKFEQIGKVHYDYERSIVWVVNLLEHNAENRTSPKIQPHIVSGFAALPDCDIRRRAIGHYNGIMPPQYRIDTLCIPIPQQQGQGAASETETEQRQEASEPESEPEPETKSQNLPAAAALPDLPADACYETADAALSGYGIAHDKRREILKTCGADWVNAWVDEIARRGDRVKTPAGLIIRMADSGTGMPESVRPPGGNGNKHTIESIKASPYAYAIRTGLEE